ncbi:MAG: hypothetical protein ACHQCE_01695 [Streptosporangiales bacterium]
MRACLRGAAWSAARPAHGFRARTLIGGWRRVDGLLRWHDLGNLGNLSARRNALVRRHARMPLLDGRCRHPGLAGHWLLRRYRLLAGHHLLARHHLLTGLARHHLLAGHDLLAGHLLARHRLLAGHHLLAGLAGHLLAGHLLAGYRLLAHWCRWGGLLPGVGCGRHAGGTLAGVGVAAPPLARGRQRLLRTWRLLGGRLAGHPGCGAGLRHARLRRHGTGGLGRLTLRRCGLAGRHSGLAGGSGRLGRRARRLLHARHGRRARRQVLGRSRPGVPGPPWLRRLLFGGRHADRARGVGRLLGTGLAVYGRLRRALVLGDDGRGVDLGRCGTRPGG